MRVLPTSADLQWVRNALAMWPRTTAVVCVIITGSNVVMRLRWSEFSDADIAREAFANLFALAWMKLMALMMVYPAMYRAPFPASFVRATSISLMFAVGFFVLVPKVGLESGPSELSTAALVPFALFSYGFSSLLMGGFMRLNYLMHRNRRVPWRRIDEM